MKIGILGGSFDPIHEGHLALAHESARQFHLDKILFVPAFLPPHKQKKDFLTAAAVRTEMIQLAIHGHPSWELCDFELNRKDVVYTVETLRHLKGLYPLPHELFFIAGADAFHDLPSWRNPEEILRLSEWIVAPRPDTKLPRPMPPRFHLLEMPVVPISASEIRQKLDRGQDVSSELPRPVWDYIRQKRVYPTP